MWKRKELYGRFAIQKATSKKMHINQPGTYAWLIYMHFLSKCKELAILIRAFLSVMTKKQARDIGAFITKIKSGAVQFCVNKI